jgi:RNA polymerase sigma-70 factor (ECF subfamily)
MRILVNQAMTILASRKRTIALDDEAQEFDMQTALVGNAAPPPSPRTHAESHETQRHVQQAIDQLPCKQRLAILLFELEDMTIAEISALLDCSPGTVKFNLHEARKKLRILLTPTFGMAHSSEAGERT